MTKRLRDAIESLLENQKSITAKIDKLREAYEDDRAAQTETSRRIEFLEECLEQGMSKREAARRLVEHDPRVGQRTAETLVYMNFSGMYQTTMRGRRKAALQEAASRNDGPEPIKAPADVEDDEGLL